MENWKKLPLVIFAFEPHFIQEKCKKKKLLNSGDQKICYLILGIVFVLIAIETVDNWFKLILRKIEKFC